MKIKNVVKKISELKTFCLINNIPCLSIGIHEFKQLLGISESYQISHLDNRIFSLFPFKLQKVKSGNDNTVEYISIPFNEQWEKKIKGINSDISKYYQYYYDENRNNEKIYFEEIPMYKEYVFPKVLKKGRRYCPYCGGTLILRVMHGFLFAKHINLNEMNQGIAFIACGNNNRGSFCKYKAKIKNKTSINGINILQYKRQDPIYSRAKVVEFYNFVV
ncbi:MAG: hypothetical protein MR601_08830, partial [Erysipelotrichaceae bacterium]|nr:hypothetical protein [Erysipelotrichaceae bacterium]